LSGTNLLAEVAFKVLAYTLWRKPNQCSHECFQHRMLESVVKAFLGLDDTKV